jgi:hypothetical protein
MMRYALLIVGLLVVASTVAEAGTKCTTYGGRGPGGWRWSQTTCR